MKPGPSLVPLLEEKKPNFSSTPFLEKNKSSFSSALILEPTSNSALFSKKKIQAKTWLYFFCSI
jgi:hypothetical protein